MKERKKERKKKKKKKKKMMKMMKKKKKKNKKKKNQGLPLSRQTPYHSANETVPSNKTSTPKATDTGTVPRLACSSHPGDLSTGVLVTRLPS